MYEEEKKGSFIKDLIIKLLYMILFLFLFMWLYPAPKVDLSDVKVKVDKTELSPLYAGIFSDNINNMKDAARTYFTTDRLPSTNGGKVKLTLKEMLNKKMLVPFVDKNGNACDTENSYVEVTRNSTYDYTLKVNLVCGEEQDYITDTIGCTSICPGCVNAPTTVAASTTKSSGYGGSKSTIYTPSSTTTVVKEVVKERDPEPGSGNNPNNNVTEPQEKVTVSFNSRGGNSVSSQKLNKGDTAYEPSTSRSGYDFLCWSTKYSDGSCVNQYDFSTPVYKNMTLYAQWVAENKTVYEYVKDVTTWKLDNQWTTSRKTGSDVREYDRRTTTETYNQSNSQVYRTISWFHGNDSQYNYGLYINDIPYNATNVRITSSPKKFTSTSDLRSWVNKRSTCYIEMIGSGCNPSGGIPSNDIYYSPIGNFSFTNSGLSQRNGRWQIYFYITNTGSYSQYTKYIAPIKFTISWNEKTTRNVTQYKYEYATTTKTYKYSTDKNDTSLLNQGYRRTGNTR